MSRSIYLTTIFVLVFAISAWAGVEFSHGGLRGGYVMPNDIDNAIGFGAEAGFTVPVPNLSLSIEGNYWSKSWEESILGSTVEAKISDISFGVSGKYEFVAVPNKLLPYVGAGAAMHLLKTEVTFLGNTGSLDDTKVGAHAFGGIRVPFNPMVSGVLEARYTVVDPDYFGVWGGINYNFAK